MSPVKNERRQKKHPNLRRGAAAKSSTKTASKGTRGRPFTKGQSGNPKGRAPGTPNKATREVKALAQSILEDPLVQQRMLLDARKGKLAPPVMTMLFHYAYGKPKERVELEVMEELRITITDDLGEDVEPQRPRDVSTEDSATATP